MNTPKDVVMESSGVVAPTREADERRIGHNDVAHCWPTDGSSSSPSRISARPAFLQSTFGWAALYDYWEPECDVAVDGGGECFKHAGRRIGQKSPKQAIGTSESPSQRSAILPSAAEKIMEFVHGQMERQAR